MTARCFLLLVCLLLALGFIAQRAQASDRCGDPNGDHAIAYFACTVQQLERENAALRDRVAALEARPPMGLSKHEVWLLSRDACWSLLLETGLVKP